MLEDLIPDAPDHIRKRIAELGEQALVDAGGDYSKAIDLLLKKLAEDETVRHPSIARLLRHGVMVSRAAR